jgi:glycosyltransferase involved in cell wall biosynthesis
MATPHFFPSLGGVETHVGEVATRMRAMGLDVTVLAADATGQLPELDEWNGVEVRRVRAWPRRGDYLFAPAINKIVSTGGWDVVHMQSYHTLVAPTVMLAARRAEVPYVLTFHGGGHSAAIRRRVRSLQLRSMRPLLAGAGRLVALTDFEIKTYGQLLRLDSSRFVRIPNGCDLPEPSAAASSSEDGTLILSVGRLERYKGHHRAIAAIPHLRERLPGVRLRIAGTGPYQPQLEAYARELGVSDVVEVRGVPPEDRAGMANLLASAELVVLLSEFETHPVAILEALALGRPTLVADGSGLSEIAARGMARAIPLESTAQRAAEAMLEELRDPMTREPVDLPTWDDCAVSLASLYDEVTGALACAS